MTRIDWLEPEFVDEIPDDLESGKLYVSISYTTAVHLCCCGCGNEVVTTLHPARWALTYDGETVSLYPSVGSWGLPCKSHYVVAKNKVHWARKWSDEKIEAARDRDRAAVAAHFGEDLEGPIACKRSLTGVRQRFRTLISNRLRSRL